MKLYLKKKIRHKAHWTLDKMEWLHGAEEIR